MPPTRSKAKTPKRKQVDDNDDDDDSSASGSSIVRNQIEVSSRFYFSNPFMPHFCVQDHIKEVQAGVQKLRQRLKTLLRENSSLKQELESKSASNETQSLLEDGSESSETRVRELEKTVKALKEVNHFPNMLLLLLKTSLFY